MKHVSCGVKKLRGFRRADSLFRR
ncbi:unnamed protein product [Spirodela intermedia]|uniref:Uncharacterized protein n=1 Tax=Spirodela intermedia TaxID=51605 RepID=A0A7I8KTA4_SPIIN|nr:unnamed protein product [Spirodela intermedia]